MITTNPLKPKKKRKYKGKEIERDETDRERKERHFAGYDDLKRLSLGIPEENEDDGCLIDDEINDEEETEEEDCLIPLKWAKLATSNPATQDKIRQTIQEARDKKNKKSDKKNCEAGNPWRDDLGRLSSVEDAASWSIGNKDGVGRSDCKYGKKKKSGSGRSTAWTKRECGREDVEDPNVKAKHRCKDGSVVKEGESEVIDDAWKETQDVFTGQIADRLQKVMDRNPSFLKHLTYLLRPLVDYEKKEPEQTERSKFIPVAEKKKNRHKGLSREQIRDLCSRSGFFGWSDFLLKLSAIEQAKKGSINQTQQKN
tara:strand:- start:614 stop:1549 length:936 start_codon:yes stop_codon:yes gene_type:complete